MPMRLDASLGFETTLDQTASVARRAEEAGVAALWTAETSHDPFLPLALAGEHTERLQLGTAIAVAFARSPLVTASTAWDLARQSRGRFLLGLGSQVRAHVERRFGMTWSGRPVAQMREYVAVVRAAWQAWQSGSRPSFRGEFYRFTLMSPVFDPGPIDHPRIPVYLAGVGAGMTRLAGEVGDGLIVHPLHSRSYVADVVLAAVADGARSTGRDAGAVTMAGSVITATSDDEMAEARRTIGFYASTPTYRPVLEHHGWGSVADALAEHARRGRWDSLAGEVSDEMLETFAVVCAPDDLRSSIERRADGLLDRVAPYAPFGSPSWRALLG
ncbi:MAG TPA: TIGR03617 family F420-dependent LLM class oxidoreductase [Methylomirabilota bacterium]|nr:TIGR03617 family F420-dependent LLM class oxidoreductase [Methylomirabilota bacterium]